VVQRDPDDGADADDTDDAAWRAIVDNYGDRPELGPDPAVGPDTEPAGDLAELDDRTEPGAGEPAWFSAPLVDPAERYVPPPPPPLPRPSRDRLAAWCGVFGAPAVLLVCLVAGIGLPSLLAYALVAAFVGGFLYLVWQMPRGPRDPWDDGAQV
jgi:hypothetical protein